MDTDRVVSVRRRSADGRGKAAPPFGYWSTQRVEQALSSIGAVLIVAGYVVKAWWPFVPAHVVVGNGGTVLGAAVFGGALVRSVVLRRRR